MKIDDVLVQIEEECGVEICAALKAYLADKNSTIKKLELEIEYMEEAGMKRPRRVREEDWE